MSWDSLIDTVLNVIVFAYVGLLIWLYFKPVAEEKSGEEN